MGYGKLVSEGGESSSTRHLQSEEEAATATSAKPRRTKLKPIIILAAVLIVASAVSAGVVVSLRNKSASGNGADGVHRKPSRAISRTCSKTRFPALCVDSLVQFPGALTASDKDLVHITVNMTLQRLGKALYDVTDISNLVMDTSSRSAYDDCLELLADSVDLLARSLTSVSPVSGGGARGTSEDVRTWLSAALTNQDTCTDGFDEVGGSKVKDTMSAKVKDLSELVSNCLAIYSAAGGDDDFSGIPIGNRRLLSSSAAEEEFPGWFSKRDRMLLESPVSSIQADIIVSQDGNGTVKTIAEAIKKAPEYSTRRIIIYVRAGKYEEDNLKVGRKKTNLMFIGDGKGKTVISGGKSIYDNVTTFHTASFGIYSYSLPSFLLLSVLLLFTATMCSFCTF
ncbi:OLC1v1027826C2 [Oldenlandia corymbosa var. corymbosa]|uniref:pectinesterase n=1 Tax=Oldenlandia corymbosa var. corymbosa TaxID=529605 RepID=A0AAV1CAC2_OLDCO|nr:OLC1v1027826C2 [Oldenlandia corymbosa var. corymbosa]